MKKQTTSPFEAVNIAVKFFFRTYFIVDLNSLSFCWWKLLDRAITSELFSFNPAGIRPLQSRTEWKHIIQRDSKIADGKRFVIQSVLNFDFKFRSCWILTEDSNPCKFRCTKIKNCAFMVTESYKKFSESMKFSKNQLIASLTKLIFFSLRLFWYQIRLNRIKSVNPNLLSLYCSFCPLPYGQEISKFIEDEEKALLQASFQVGNDQ